MARFPFSLPGRKKSALQLKPTEPLSKAHRVLGSTPLSIDSPPPHWDDGSSSSVASDKHVGTTAPSAGHRRLDSHGLHDNHPVSIAKSEDGWRGDSDALPHPLRLNAVGLGDCYEADRSTVASSILRNSLSSSTMKSWYDRANMPLAISQQTSSSAMAKGLPSKAERILDVDDFYGNKPRKKPGKLDLSAIMPGPRRPRVSSHSRQDVGAAVLGPEYLTRSPSVLTPTSPPARQTEQKRAKRGARLCSTSEARLSGARSGSPWLPSSTLGELPSLYDHYEQMSLRQLMRHGSLRDTVEAEGHAEATQHSPQQESKARQRPQPMPPTPKTVMYSSILKTPSPSNCAASNRHIGAPKMPRALEQYLESADLHQTSVLMLSSDSDDDDDDLDSSTTATTAATTTTSRSPAGPSLSRTSTRQDDASFESTSIRVDARTVKSLDNASQKTPSSRRVSFVSTISSNSAATRQSRSVHSIGESRATPLHSSLRSTKAGLEQEAPRASLQLQFDQGAFHHMSPASSTDQLTPPLSPSSVDFYIRSGRSSIDGPESHNRLMAVSRQEEMLLAALRHKQDSFRCSVLANLQGSPTDDGENRDRSSQRDLRPRQRRSRGHRSRTPQSPGTDATFDFGFPAPPGPRDEMSTPIDDGSARRHRSTSRHSSGRRSSRRRSPVAMGAGDYPALGNGISSSMFAVAGPSAGPLPEEIPVFLDMEPSPDLSDFRDWDVALSPVSEDVVSNSTRPAARKGSASRRHGGAQSLRPHATLGQDGTSRAVGGRLAGVAEENGDEEDVPRPDSPISPECFPAVPRKRTTRNNMARLSAVGPGPLSGGAEPA